MNVSYLGLGSNQKFPERQLRRAIRSIASLPFTSIIKISSFYKTKAWGLQNQQDFCNAAIQINTRLSPWALLRACQKIENLQGRVRKRPWGPRIIDIDILLYNNQVLHTETLIIPHPHILSRDFVLIPLQEINKQFIKS